MEEISPIHQKWAKLMKEHVTQQENDMDDVNFIVKRLLMKPTNKKSVDNAAYVTASTTVAFFLELVFFYVFSLSNQKKLKIHQDKLHKFFIGNPSSVRNPQPPSLNLPSSPMRGVNFQPPIDSPPMVRLNPGANLAATATLPPFNPMVFLQQLSPNMGNMGVPHQAQTIVVESRADKSHKSEAKFNNNMLQLLLIGGNADITTPGSFANPRILTYTQAMKNIITQPTLVQATHLVNILTTVFAEIPNNLAEMLSPLTMHKSMPHISKNFASSILACNFQRTNLDSLNFEISSTTILTFVGQSDAARVEASREAEQVAKTSVSLTSLMPIARH
jgi:hypothetical protein